MEILNQETISFIENHTLLFVLILAWSLAWKGWALWKSARLSHKWWFVILLVVNTVGVLEMIYIFLIARKYQVESKETR